MTNITMNFDTNILVNAIHAATWILNLQTGELSINERWADMIGYSLEELQPVSILTWNSLTHPEDVEKSNKEFQRLHRGEISRYHLEIRMKHKLGHWVYLLDSGQIMEYDKDRMPLIAMGVHLDITESKILQLKLEARERLLSQIIENTKDIIYKMDLKGNLTFLSNAWEVLLGYSLEESIGTSVESYIHPDDKRLLLEFLTKVQYSKDHESLSDYRFRRADGTYCVFETNASPILENGEIVGIAGVARDISIFIKKQQEIEFLSYRDQLTKLFNRHYLEKVRDEVKAEKNHPLGIITMDMNDLKLVNDTYGHDEGDRLLVKVSDIFRHVFPADSLIFRMGGDEFMVVLPLIEEEILKQMKERLEELLDEYGKEAYPVTIALGYFISHDPQEDLFDALKKADAYMYEDKRIYKSRKCRKSS
ncbi:sensor domain-containing diguanylate cyclase [Proteiniclasticum ruminis]|uniref:sensor domain-containing diguanylate cyclase n=1 Tax=Proteiniclasticum ruminis TaxID=398199 RepID=UPI0028AE196E|nr:PAS domain-containing protein [Proteiniclasticum ruminis]